MNHLPTNTDTPKERNGIPIIAWRNDGVRDQVEIKDGIAYIWRYGITEKVFCNVSEIKEWRECNGFDY